MFRQLCLVKREERRLKYALAEVLGPGLDQVKKEGDFLEIIPRNLIYLQEEEKRCPKKYIHTRSMTLQ